MCIEVHLCGFLNPDRVRRLNCDRPNWNPANSTNRAVRKFGLSANFKEDMIDLSDDQVSVAR